ncbi:MAG: Holliday junction resolvase RuvX [Methylocystaceae bacterium]
MRLMGLDVGDKRIGVAVNDLLNLTAQPIAVIERKGMERDLAEIDRLCKQYEVEKLIVGLPLNMNGTLGPKAHQVQEFGHLVAGNLDLLIEFFDERLTTKQAETMLIQADVSRSRRREVIDKLAAAHILQTYMDAKRNQNKNQPING